jgi:hypothetical protein
MTKFRSLSINDFFTAEAAEGRKARDAAFVVAVEVDDGSWCELDAEDGTHAERLAETWVDLMNARGASCRAVKPDGTLVKKPFFTHYNGGSESAFIDGEDDNG